MRGPGSVVEATGEGRRAQVWAATWVAGTPPVEGLGADGGYGVAFVTVESGPTLQVLVAGATPPAPGLLGWVRSEPVGDAEIDVFTPEVQQ